MKDSLSSPQKVMHVFSLYSDAIILRTIWITVQKYWQFIQSFRKSSVFLLRFLSKGVMILSVVDDMESPILKQSQFFTYNFHWFSYLVCCLRWWNQGVFSGKWIKLCDSSLICPFLLHYVLCQALGRCVDSYIAVVLSDSLTIWINCVLSPLQETEAGTSTHTHINKVHSVLPTHVEKGHQKGTVGCYGSCRFLSSHLS